MAFVKKTWTDRMSQYPMRRTLTKEGGAEEVVTVARNEGTVFAEGDAFDAETMNDLEGRIDDAFGDVATKAKLYSTLADAQADISNIMDDEVVYVKQGDTAELTGRVDDLATTRSKLGAKNLLPYPYYRPSGYTSQGMTATYDEDGVITVNKVAGTSTAYFGLYSNNTDYFLKPNTSYILSLELENAKNTSIYVSLNSRDIAAIRNKASGYYEYKFTTGATFTNYLMVGLYFPNTDTETNAIVKPMIRLVTDHDSTYQPYAMTNKELTGAVAQLNTDLSELPQIVAGEVTVTGNAGAYSGVSVPVPFNTTDYAVLLSIPFGSNFTHCFLAYKDKTSSSVTIGFYTETNLTLTFKLSYTLIKY